MRRTYTLVKWAAYGCLFLFILACTPDEPAAQDSATEEPANSEKLELRMGAEVLFDTGLAALEGKRVGLIVNHTATVDERHLIDVIHSAPEVELVALFGPEHGIRGNEDAGALVKDGVDQQTGVPIFSLHKGDTRKPAKESLEGIDVLVFDIQDIGARFYTYISTLGLTMQAAAEQGVSFMVLDRPNPLGGNYVSGYVMEEANTSFVGQYTIPVAHGMTVGELALMIKGEGFMEDLEDLDLTVVDMQGWTRDMTWDQLSRPWIAPSPNIPDFQTAIVYAGMCFFEAVEASEGRGSRMPFRQVGATWGNAEGLTNTMRAYNLEGVAIEEVTFTPVSIEGMSSNPRFKDEMVQGVKLSITEVAAFLPVETGIYALHAFYHASPSAIRSEFINDRWMRMLAGTDRLRDALQAGDSPQTIVDSWGREVTQFRDTRAGYLLYE